MTILPENLKSIISSTWDFHPNYCLQINYHFGYVVLYCFGTHKSTSKIEKNTGLSQEVISNCCSLLYAGTPPQPQ